MSRFPKTTLLASAVAALVLSMGSAVAADATTAATQAPAPQHVSARNTDNEPVTGTQIRSHTKDLAPIVVVGGAVHAKGDVQWTDNDTSVPELPVTHEQDSGMR